MVDKATAQLCVKKRGKGKCTRHTRRLTRGTGQARDHTDTHGDAHENERGPRSTRRHETPDTERTHFVIIMIIEIRTEGTNLQEIPPRWQDQPDDDSR